MIDQNRILQALSVIIDPDFKKSIVELGFVKNIKINGTTVGLDIELTTPACPVKESFRQQAERILLNLPGVELAVVNMTARGQDKKRGEGLKNVNSIIAVASCKGGVGKSTTAATVACELKNQGFKVGLLDLDLYGPSVPTLFTYPQADILQRDQMLVPVEYQGLKLMSFGWLLGDGPAVMRGPMVSGYVGQLLTSTNWGELDYLIIDMPPGTGDIQLTMAQSIQLDGAVIVTTPASLAIVDVIKGILMFEKVGIPVLAVVNNMSYFICDHCETKHYLFGNETRSLTDRFGIQTIIDIPLEKSRGQSFAHYQSSETNRHLVDNVVRAIGSQKISRSEAPKAEMTNNGLLLKWHNGEEKTLNYFDLRNNCRCALCVDEYTGEKLLQESHIPHDIHLLEATPLGSYALAMKWSDGHSSSIYPYQFLKEL